MRTITIDTTAPATIRAGRIGEHNATTIAFTVPPELAAAADYYRAAIEVNGELHYTGVISPTDRTFSLLAEHTQADRAAMTIEGYKDAGDFVGKAAKINLLFGAAAAGAEPAENTGTLVGLVDAAVTGAITTAINTQVPIIIQDALAGYAGGGIAIYQDPADLPTNAPADTIALLIPPPAWDKAPEQFLYRQYLPSIYYNENPPDPQTALPENKEIAQGLIVQNTDLQTVRPFLYLETAKASDFVDENPAAVFAWNFNNDGQGEPTAIALYLFAEAELWEESFGPGWYKADLENETLIPTTFKDLQLPWFDFEPRIIYDVELQMLVPVGYAIHKENAWSLHGIGSYISVSPYKTHKFYRKTEDGWEEIT